MAGPGPRLVRVLVLADDLIWSTRLAAYVRSAGAEPRVVATLDAYDAALVEADRVIVDLTARGYDGLEAVERASRAGREVICVGQHDDHALRRRARAAGAAHVYAYRGLHVDGPAAIARWLVRPGDAGTATGRDRDERRKDGLHPMIAPTTKTGPAPARPAIPMSRYGGRLAAAQAIANERGLAALLVGVGADLRYLTGYEAMPLERLTMLVVPAAGPITLVAPRLEMTPARHCPAAAGALIDVVGWEETEDPVILVAGLVRSSAAEPVERGIRVAVSDRLWASFVLRLQAALPGAHLGLGSEVLGELRVVKDADEVSLLRLAALAADRVVARIAGGRLVGRTEADVSREVRDRLVAEGHETAQFAIVGSGPNSASPHHEASDRVIEAGEPIVLDIGGILGGYCSDITRTLWVTGGDPAHGPDDEFLRLYSVLRAAHADATHGVRPGVPAERIDAIAREIITAGGHGPHFIHRVGHGIGLEGHEDPYLVAGNDQPLREGMAFSVEPGIYLEGRCGARIEDIVVCAADGPQVLNGASRDLFVVSGH